MAIDTLDATAPARKPTTPPRSRRAILAAALGGLGGLLASRLATPDSAAAAAGDPLIIGNTTNTAGTANTSLTTASAGTALLVTQNGSGTALRGSAVGAGSIAGFFTAANGTGISGVTGNPNSYGVYGANDDAAAGSGAAIRASGKNNHGVLATTTGAAANAVRATTSSAAPNVAAIYGEVSSTAPGSSSAAVRGHNKGLGSAGSGVVGYHAGTGIGIDGNSTAGTGVSGVSSSGIGVDGFSSSGTAVSGQSGSNIGVYGTSNSYTGVYGTSGSGTGVFGFSGSSYAGYFQGPLYAVSFDAGSVSATVKNFRIDHPDDPAGKILVHSCVESNERLTVYAGTVTTDMDGEAVVALPAYFDALNRDLRYQLTPLADARAWIKREVAGNRFTLATSEPATKVCWQVTGVRQDAYAKAHPLVVEAVKAGKEKGKYLNPVEHGKPESAGVDYELRQAMRREARVPAA